MRDAIEIMKDFQQAMNEEEWNMPLMMCLIKEMKQTDPAFVDLMLNCLYEDEDDE